MLKFQQREELPALFLCGWDPILSCFTLVIWVWILQPSQGIKRTKPAVQTVFTEGSWLAQLCQCSTPAITISSWEGTPEETGGFLLSILCPNAQGLKSQYSKDAVGPLQKMASRFSSST